MRVAIIGQGRMGRGLGGALALRGQHITLLGRRQEAVQPPFSLLDDGWAPAIRAADVVIICVRDEMVEGVAEQIAQLDAVGPAQAVLHVSGPLDRTALLALEPSGAALGSFHPLQTISDPTRAAQRLHGAWAGLEGDERALDAGRRLCNLLAMRPIVIPGEAKGKYHAAAVIAANYLVGLLGVAQRLAEEAGIDRATAEQMYLPLAEGALANVLAQGPAAALTGPIRRGDLTPLRVHLLALSESDRQLYRAVGLATLRLAREAGLDERRAQQVEEILRGKA